MEEKTLKNKIAQLESQFNKSVINEAEALLVEIARQKKTYGEIKKTLKGLRSYLIWTNKNNHYLNVIDEVETLLEKEIDATVRG